MKNRSLPKSFTEGSYSKLVDEVNTSNQNLTLEDNFNGQVLENIVLPADSTTVEIPHRLKVVPKYMIILRQKGAGIVIDGNREWNSRTIFLRRINAVAQGSGSAVIPFNDTYLIDGGDSGGGVFATTPNSITIPSSVFANNPTDVDDDVTITILLMKG